MSRLDVSLNRLGVLGVNLIDKRPAEPETFPERVLGTMRCLCGLWHYVDADGVVEDGVCWAERRAKEPWRTN